MISDPRRITRAIVPRTLELGHDKSRGSLLLAVATAQETAKTREERKVVTVLFCRPGGLHGAARSGSTRRTCARFLQPYHARLRAELERFGGTVEKFIGDAVMAVFGAPVAHEDDPERAVRAALRDPRLALARGRRAARCGSA